MASKQVIVLALVFVAVAGLVSAAPPEKKDAPAAGKATPAETPKGGAPAASPKGGAAPSGSKAGGPAKAGDSPAPSTDGANPGPVGGEGGSSPAPSASSASTMKISAVAAGVAASSLFFF